MKRIIKLINNERLAAKIQASKACVVGSYDYCTTNVDNGTCTQNSYDLCNKDHAGCTNYSYDNGSISDHQGCYTGSEDRCGIDVE